MTWGNQNSEAEAHEQLSYAFDNGVNILDTAEMYPVPSVRDTQGQTDRYISTWLRTMPRDKYDYDLGSVRESVPFVEQLRGLQDVIAQGKVRYVGVSNETPYGVMQFVRAAEEHGLPKIVSIQNSYSLLVRLRLEVDLNEVCAPHHANVGLLAYSPLAGGALTGKYIDADSEAARKGRLNVFSGYMKRFKDSLAQEAVGKYVQVAQKHGLTPAQLALAFVRDRWFVTSNIIGATTMAQLQENLSAYTLQRPLPAEVQADIDDVFRRHRDPSFTKK
eukprot:SM000221S06941  [mRNA]  locus=s221:161523:163746:+ [translate_table: standard]